MLNEREMWDTNKPETAPWDFEIPDEILLEEEIDWDEWFNSEFAKELNNGFLGGNNK